MHKFIRKVDFKPTSVGVIAFPLLLAVCLTLAIGMLGLYAFEAQKQQIRKEGEAMLKAVASLKAGQIGNWLDERKANAFNLGSQNLLSALMAEQQESANFSAQKRQWLSDRLEMTAQAYKFHSLVLFDRHGRKYLEHGTSNDRNGDDVGLVGRALRERQIVTRDLHGDDYQNAELDLAAPLTMRIQGEIEVVGALLMHVDPARFLLPLIQTWPTPSSTAETMLLRREGDQVLFLNELRHQRGTALRLRLPADMSGLLDKYEWQGESGIVAGLDYRNVPVIGFLQPIPDTPWFIISKIDETELYAPLHRLGLYVTLAGILLLLAGYAALAFWWRERRAEFAARSAHAEFENKALARHLEYLSKFSNDIVMLVDDAGRIVEANDRASDAYGYAREELIGMKAIQLRAPEVMVDFSATLQRLHADGRLVYETLQRRKDGSIFPIESSLREIEIDGRTFVQGIGRDISERKRAGEEIIQMRDFYLKLLDHLPAMIWRCGADGRCNWFNATWLAFTGRTLAQEIADGGLDGAHPDDLGYCKRSYLEAFNQRRPFELEYRLRRHDGEYRWMIDNGIPFESMDGEFAGYIGFCVDVTERVTLERELLSGAQLTTAIIDSLSNVIAVTDDEGEIIRVNKAWRNFAADNGADEQVQYGVGLNYFAVCQAAVAVDVPLAEAVLAGMRQVQRGELPLYAVEYECHGPQQRRWFQLRVTSLGGDLGMHGLVVSHTDITQRKLVELTLVEDQQLLEERVILRTQELEVSAAALRHQERLLQHILDHIPGMVSYWDRDLCNVFANSAYVEFFGKTPDEICGMHIRTLLGDHIYSQNLPHIQCALRGEPQMFERMLQQPGIAEVRYTQAHYVPYRSAGEVEGLLILMFDITEVKRAEVAARQASAEAERLAQLRSDFLANMSHEIRTPLNAILGFAQTGLRDVAAPQSGHVFERILDAGRLLMSIINDILDFSKIEAGKMSIEKVDFDLGQIVDRVVDLNAQNAYAKNLEFRLEEADDLPLVMLGDPLRLSQVLLNLLANAIKFTERGFVTLRISRMDQKLVFEVQDSGIGMNADQMARLFQPFSQADSSITRQFGGTGLGLAISRRLVELMGGEIFVSSEPGHGATFTLRVPLQSVSPAPASSTHPTVWLAGLPDNEALPLSVALTARGVSARSVVAADVIPDVETIDLLVVDCRQYAAVEATDARRLVKRLGVACMPGEGFGVCVHAAGDCVALERPLCARRLIAAATTSSGCHDQARPVGPRLAGVRILVAEDNAVNRLVLETILKQEGASLTCLENGLEVCEQLQVAGAMAYDLVIVDIQMPVMDGYAATQRIHEIAPAMPVIGLTAHASQEDRQRCLDVGMVDHLTKPIDIELLVAVLLRHLPNRIAHQGAIMQPGIRVAPETEGDTELRSENRLGMVGWSALLVRFHDDQRFVRKLMAAALDSQSTTPERLRAAQATMDFQGIATLAHNLKGMSANLMLPALRDLAQQTEISAHAAETQAAHLAEALALETQRLLEELRKSLDA